MFPINPPLSESAYTLLERLLDIDSATRPSAREALRLQFFATLKLDEM